MIFKERELQQSQNQLHRLMLAADTAKEQEQLIQKVPDEIESPRASQRASARSITSLGQV